MADKRILLFAITFLSGYCSAGFVETPSSITTEYETGVNKTVVFRCRHEEPFASIVWELNGTSSRAYPDVVESSVREDGIPVDKLTVPVITAYNGTEVVCSTTVNGVIEETPAALLIVTESTSSPMTTTTLSATTPLTTPSPTTQPPTTPPTGDFLTTPSLNIAAMEKGRVIFNCEHSTGTDIFWSVYAPSGDRIASTPLEKVDLPGGGVASNVTIDTLPEHNQTSIECGVVVGRGSSVQYAPATNLLIQGIPGNVSNLKCMRPSSTPTNLTTRWDSVFSLDLNDTEPDIVYEFEVYDITCGRHDLIHNDTVMVNSTSNSIDPAQLYKVVVAARNNVANAVNGTGADASEEFLTLDATMLFELYTKKLTNVAVTQDLPPLPVPRYYMVNLTSSDGRDLIITRNVTVTRKQDLITLWLNEGIPPRTLWDASVSAYGCQEHMVKGTVLSTHEIQDLSVTSKSGEIRVMGTYVDGSTATGALIIVYSLTNDSDVRYTTTGLEQRIDVNVTDLHGSRYGVSAFVLDDGVPFNRTVAMPKSVSLSPKGLKSRNSLESTSPSSIQYALQSTSSGVCITCTFLESSTTDCVAVVHQRISQLNSNGLMNIESSHKFTRSGDTASGCIEGVNLEDYQVGIIAITQTISPTTNSLDPVPAIVGGSVTTALVVLLVVVVVLSLVLFMRSKKINKTNEKENEAKTKSGLPSAAGCSCVCTGSFTIGTVIGCFVPQCITSNRDATAPDVEAGLASPDLESPPPLPKRTQESNMPIEQEQVLEDPPVAIESSNTTTDTVSDHPASALYDTPQLPDSSEVPPPQYATPDLKVKNTPATSPWEAATSHSQVSNSHNDGQQPPSSSTAQADSLYAVPAKSHKTSSPSPTLQNANVGNSHTNTSSPPSTSTGTGGSTYAELEVRRKHPTVSCPPAADTVQYNEIHQFQNSNGQHYAMIADLEKPTSNLVLDDLQKTVYSEIKQPQAHTTPSKLLEVNSCGPEEPCHSPNNSTATVEPIPFDLEHLLPGLMGVASKWKSLGEALSLDDDIVDEIFTNNETDEECLREMLERYLMRSDLKHNWEEIEEALASIEKDSSGGSGTECSDDLKETSALHSKPASGSSSEGDATHVSQSSDGGTSNTAVCVQTSKMPPTVIGGDRDDRTSEAVQLSGSYDSGSFASSSPKPFSLCREHPSCSPVQPSCPPEKPVMIRQETQNPAVDFMSEMRETLQSKCRPLATRHTHIQKDLPTATSTAKVCRDVHKTGDSPSSITHGTLSASGEGPPSEELPQKDEQVDIRKLLSRFSKQVAYQISQTCLWLWSKTTCYLKKLHRDFYRFITTCAQKRYLIICLAIICSLDKN